MIVTFQFYWLSSVGLEQCGFRALKHQNLEFLVQICSQRRIFAAILTKFGVKRKELVVFRYSI